MLFLTDVLLSAPAAPAVDLENISILNAAIVAGLGYLVVFVGLIALMAVVIALGKYFQAAEAKAKGYTMSAEAKEYLDSQLASLKTEAENYGYKDVATRVESAYN